MDDREALTMITKWYTDNKKTSEFINSLNVNIEKYGRLTEKQRSAIDKDMHAKGLVKVDPEQLDRARMEGFIREIAVDEIRKRFS